MPISQQRPEKRLKWSKRSIADREKIGAFYKEEASVFVALEADKSILAAAKKLKIDSLAFRVGHKAGTREYVMRRFPYILFIGSKKTTLKSFVFCTKLCAISTNSKFKESWNKIFG